MSQVLASRTYAELAALTADVPAEPTTAKPPTPARAQGGQSVLRPGLVITAPTLLYAGVWVYAIFFPKGGNGPSKLPLVFDTGLVYLIILATCVGVMIALRVSSAQAGSHRGGQQRGRAARHRSGCHRPIRASSYPRPIKAASTSPRLREAVARS